MILAAGLSPAWQQILRFDRFAVGEVNRASESYWCASGKVLNVGIALYYLGADVLTLSSAGGETGRCLQQEFAAAGIPTRWIETESASRVCTTILDHATNRTTELVENTPEISETELQQFRVAFRDEAARADCLIVSGSIPAGVPKSIWCDLLQELPGAERRVILDIRGEELLLALESRPFLIKPNREELAATFGRSLTVDARLVEAMRELNERGAEWVVVTNGSQTVWMTASEETYRLQPPSTEAVNPIGSGDCLTAGIGLGLEQGLPPVDCVQLGIAAAVENAKQILPGRLDPQRVLATAKDVTCERA